MAETKARMIYDATDAFMVAADDGAAILNVLTKQDIDLAIVLAPEILARLRSQIARPTKQSAAPSAPPSEA